MHLFIDILRNAILITGLVTVMMMMIESVNIESKGMIFRGLRKTKIGQVVIAALLGSVPGCMGGFATVSLYTHGLLSFGALVAMLIATSGDESFMMLAMFPDKALIIFTLTFIIAVVTGIITDIVKDKFHKKKCNKEDHSECADVNGCQGGYIVHEEHEASPNGHNAKKPRHYGWKRMSMFIGLALFIAALATGQLAHEHEAHHHTLEINLLSEDWMNVMFAGLSVLVLFVLLLASDHFIEEHLWNHIVKKHVPTIFVWTFGVLLIIGWGLQYIDISHWISDNTSLMIILAAVVGIIPESGPHLIFVTLYASGVIPLPVLLASSISQDGHASIPLLAESKKSFAYAKLINVVVAIVAGFIAWSII